MSMSAPAVPLMLSHNASRQYPLKILVTDNINRNRNTAEWHLKALCFVDEVCMS